MLGQYRRSDQRLWINAESSLNSATQFISDNISDDAAIFRVKCQRNPHVSVLASTFSVFGKIGKSSI